MNTKIEEIKRITDSFDTLTSEERNTLMDGMILK